MVSFTGFYTEYEPKNMQKVVKTDSTCNIQQSCELLANNFASVYGLGEKSECKVFKGKRGVLWEMSGPGDGQWRISHTWPQGCSEAEGNETKEMNY